MNPDKTINIVEEAWNQSIIPQLCRYIEIPCKSPAFESDWEKLGFLDQAIELVSQWCLTQNVRGLKLKVHRLPGRTPLLTIEIEGQIPQTIVMYGHLDKQPEMVGWREDLGPWKPVLRDERLYGRGGADDGYAVFSAITAIRALQEQNVPHARCFIMIETCEESGSYDLPYYLDLLEKEIGEPNLVIGLDSGCGNYEQFWSTTSLRGMIRGLLTVEILTEGIHSAAGGMVPSSFRILRQLLNRIEDEKTGHILLPELQADIPLNCLEETKNVAECLQQKVWEGYPWVKGASVSDIALDELILNRTWRSSLELIGIEDVPNIANAGNVLRPKTTAMLAVRVSPICDPRVGAQAMKRVLEADPPYGALVNFDIRSASFGWKAPEREKWLEEAVDSASMTYFDKPALYWGEGGSIPFIYILGEKYPHTQFVIAGVLGPDSNAHGPNEFLDIPVAKKITCCVANIVHAHYQQFSHRTSSR